MKPIYAIKDRAIDGYEEPFAQPSQQHAIRSFTDWVNADPQQSKLAAHPDDYDLYQVGEYDETQGILHPVDTPQLICRGKDRLQPRS